MIVKTVTKDDIQKALPSRKNTVTDELVQIINEAASDPEFQGESLLQTMTTYENVMLNNRASIKEFANAVKRRPVASVRHTLKPAEGCVDPLKNKPISGENCLHLLAALSRNLPHRYLC